MSDVHFTPETYPNQFVPKVPSNVPNVEELQTRLRLMAAVPGSGVDVAHDTEAEALNKLAKIGISGEKIPLSDNQLLAKEYREAAKNGTESELVTIYRGTNDPNLNKLLDAYVVESKIRSQALEMPDHKGEPLKEFPPAFHLVIHRVQENVAMMIETGAQLQTNGVKPSEQERLAVLTHLEKMHGHADSKAITHASEQYEPTL